MRGLIVISVHYMLHFSCTHTHTHIHTHTHTHTHTRTHTHTPPHTQHPPTHTHTRTQHPHTYTHTHTTPPHVHTHNPFRPTHKHKHTHTCMQHSLHTHIHTHKHTHTYNTPPHTHIHTQPLPSDTHTHTVPPFPQSLRPEVGRLRTAVDKAVSNREQYIHKFCTHLDRDIEELDKEAKEIKNEGQVSLITDPESDGEKVLEYVGGLLARLDSLHKKASTYKSYQKNFKVCVDLQKESRVLFVLYI